MRTVSDCVRVDNQETEMFQENRDGVMKKVNARVMERGTGLECNIHGREVNKLLYAVDTVMMLF